MPDSTSRFSQYRTDDDLPHLHKLGVGESFTARLDGDHDYQGDPDPKTGKLPKPVPVLELSDPETGEEFAWRAGTWSAIEQLEIVDPQPGDVIKVTRFPDRGRSHTHEVTIVTRAAPPESDIPADSTGLPDAKADTSIPFHHEPEVAWEELKSHANR